MNKPVSSEEVDPGEANLIDEIIRLSDYTFDRLPMLNIIGERLVDNASAALTDLTGAPCGAVLTALDYIPMGQVIENLPTPALLAIGAGSPFDGDILVVFDQTLLLTSIELMLGGSAKQIRQEPAENFTAIEMDFGERLSAAILQELQHALSVVGAASLALHRVETDPDNAAIAKHASLCARLKYAITLAGHTGNLEVVIPYDALETIRPDLSKIYFGDRGDDQSNWQDMISGQIERAHMELEAVLAVEAISLQRIVSWKPGDTIDFGIEDGEPAIINCAGAPMFKASLGSRNNGFIAVRITEEIEQKETTEDDRDDS